MRSIRGKSLLIDFLFTPAPLSHGDDARSLIARCMGYDHQTPGQQAQSDEPIFPVSKTVVFERDARPGKYCSASSKLRPCLARFFRFFASSHSYFISFRSYCNAFCSYRRARSPSQSMELTGCAVQAPLGRARFSRIHHIQPVSAITDISLALLENET